MEMSLRITFRQRWLQAEAVSRLINPNRSLIHQRSSSSMKHLLLTNESGHFLVFRGLLYSQIQFNILKWSTELTEQWSEQMSCCALQPTPPICISLKKKKTHPKTNEHRRRWHSNNRHILKPQRERTTCKGNKGACSSSRSHSFLIAPPWHHGCVTGGKTSQSAFLCPE